MIRRLAATLVMAFTALSPSIPEASQAPPAPMVTAVEVISQHRLTGAPPEQLLTGLVGNPFSRARVRESEFRATSLTTLAQMVAGGAGVTLLPRLAVPTEAARSGLRTRAFTDPQPHRTIGLVWRRACPIAPALRDVAAIIRAAYPRK